MTKLKKIASLSGVVALVAGAMVLLSFVGTMRTGAVCEAMLITISGSDSLRIVSESDIRQSVNTTFGPAIGSPFRQLDIRAIEEYVARVPHVKTAKVFGTIDKKLVIDIMERSPMVRLIDQNGVSAILDTEGYLMSLPKPVTLRLPIVSGAFSVREEWLEGKINLADTAQSVAMAEVYRYSKAITSSPFWSTQLQQSERDKNGNFVAYPQVGNHELHFGRAVRMNQKLARLKVFYTEGYNASNFNKYKVINLKYKDQIVCTKK